MTDLDQAIHNLSDGRDAPHMRRQAGVLLVMTALLILVAVTSIVMFFADEQDPMLLSFGAFMVFGAGTTLTGRRTLQRAADVVEAYEAHS